jgi:hypothetical protein
MAFAALGRHPDSIGRKPVGRTATGASNDNLVSVVHWSPHLNFFYIIMSQMPLSKRDDRGQRTDDGKN